MKPLLITIVGQISVHESSLEPFAAGTNWSLLPDFAERNLKLAIVDPWLFDDMAHDDFLRAINNLCLLSESIVFPSFCQSTPFKRVLNVERLYQDIIILFFPFFKQKVRLLLIRFLLQTL
jgi:hypothetical protein